MFHDDNFKMTTTLSSAAGPAKKEKLSREVLELLSGGTVGGAPTDLPPIVPSFPGAHYKITGKLATEVTGGSSTVPPPNKRTKWVWAPFSSSARHDGALFHHWVKSHVEYPDYPYARFDVHLDSLHYTEEEYDLFCKGTEKDLDEGYAPWTKSETDILMNLCKQYELRWPVIYDRYRQLLEDNGVELRTLEELQYRYYAISTALIKARVEAAVDEEVDAVSASNKVIAVSSGNSAPDALASGTHMSPQLVKQAMKHRIVSHLGTGASTREFAFQKERARRLQLEVLWNRSRKEEEIETKLREELKLIETQLRKLKKSGKHILAAQEAASAATEAGIPLVEDASSLIETASTAFDAPFASSGLLGNPGVPFLQSSRLALPPATAGGVLNKTLLKKLELTLQELNIPEKPIATKRVCDACDIARKSILTLLTLQKIASQREKDVALKQQRLVKAQNAAVAAKARASALAAVRDSGGAPPTTALAAGAPAAGSSGGQKPAPLPTNIAKESVGALTTNVEGPPAIAATMTYVAVKAKVEGSSSIPAATTAVAGSKADATVDGIGSTLVATAVNVVSRQAALEGSALLQTASGNNTSTALKPLKNNATKSKKKSTVSATAAPPVKGTASTIDPIVGVGKSKKRKSTTNPKLNSQSHEGAGMISTMPTVIASTAPTEKNEVVTTPSSTLAQGTVMKPGAPPVAEATTPFIAIAASSVLPVATSGGSEDGKNSKKRAKKN